MLSIKDRLYVCLLLVVPIVIIGPILVEDTMIPPMKHVLDDIFTIAAGTVSDQVVNLAVGTLNPDPYTTNNAVRNGSKVGDIKLMLDIYSTKPYDANLAIIFDWYVGFNINGAQSMPAPNAVGNSHLKNQIFHQDQGVIPLAGAVGSPADSVANNELAKWRVKIGIPTQYRQINEGDVIEFHIIKAANVTPGTVVKLKAIYTEYFP